MARVTPAEVQQVYKYDTATIIDADAEVFIDGASGLVDNISGLNAAKLKNIERWLAAHFINMQDPQASSEKADVVGQSLLGKVDLNLNQSRYGQNAMIFDTTGYLATLNEQAKGKGGPATLMVLNPSGS